MRILATLILTLTLSGVWAQNTVVSCSSEDRDYFTRLIKELQSLSGWPMDKNMIHTGKAFLGTPYQAGTLEVEPREVLVVNFQGLDCTTFVENVLVLSRMRALGQTDWDKYLAHLEQVRYRKGQLRGYPSRLHYFTEWIRDNTEKGLIKDITGDLNGIELNREINFMGTHRELYPFLASDVNYRSIREIEKELSNHPICLLPKKEVENREGEIQDGDIIALATKIPGLDVTHTGIAIRLEDGRIHLLHASTEGQVMITKEPLADYLTNIEGNTGIIVARPLAPTH